MIGQLLFSQLRIWSFPVFHNLVPAVGQRENMACY